MIQKTQTTEFIQSLFDELSTVDSFYEEHFQDLSPSQWHWKPNPKLWSIAQCVEHIILTNEGYMSHMEKILSKPKNQHKTPHQEFKSDWIGKRFMKALLPESTEKFKAPKIFTPSDQPSDVQSRLKACNRLLEDFIHKAEHYDLNIKIPLLESRLIYLKLGDRLKTLIMHKIRHLNQAYRVKMHPDFPEK